MYNNREKCSVCICLYICVFDSVGNNSEGYVIMTYNLFISHSWKYSIWYEGLINLLNKKQNFSYKNYSVPKDDPIHNAPYTYQLKEAIRRQIQPANCVLILVGVYSSYIKLINIEIELAKGMNKKIIAIQPFGAERTSKVVKDAADVIVGWNTDSIVNAIRGY